jgi:uncharacterized membrane protein YdfJ with MMPL/SSD domain
VQAAFAGDAAFGVHEKSQSHSGSTATLGRGTINAQSQKQKLNSGSSSESELVALGEVAQKVAWTRMFLFYLGYIQRATVVYQDNKSTIMLAENGPSSSGKSKHFQRRFFAVKQMIEHGEVTLVYLPTEEMVADALTKPLTGQRFHKMARRLQGECDMHDDIVAGVEEPC